MSYNPQLHTASNKSYAPSGNIPTDARSVYYDEARYLYRSFVSEEEVLNNLDEAFRNPGFEVIINSTGILQSDGTILGGNNIKYYFSTSSTLVKSDSVISIEDTLTSTSRVDALSANQGYLLNNTKQELLVSGSNIKTINGNSLLGSGNITIDSSGTSITVDTELSSTSNNAIANSTVTNALAIKVDSVDGKVLSSNDFTDNEKIKLESLNNYDDSTIRSEIALKQDILVSGTSIKTINSQSLLGSGDIAIASESTTIVDTLTSVSTTSALSANQGYVLNNSKQDTLVSGTNIKTLNGSTLLGSGNITTPEQVNITAGDNVTITGTYPDLTISASVNTTVISSGDINLAYSIIDYDTNIVVVYDIERPKNYLKLEGNVTLTFNDSTGTATGYLVLDNTGGYTVTISNSAFSGNNTIGTGIYFIQYENVLGTIYYRI